MTTKEHKKAVLNRLIELCTLEARAHRLKMEVEQGVNNYPKCMERLVVSKAKGYVQSFKYWVNIKNPIVKEYGVRKAAFTPKGVKSNREKRRRVGTFICKTFPDFEKRWLSAGLDIRKMRLTPRAERQLDNPQA